MFGDHALDLRVDAARTLASLCREHVEIARELGERDVLDALRCVLCHHTGPHTTAFGVVNAVP